MVEKYLDKRRHSAFRDPVPGRVGLSAALVATVIVLALGIALGFVVEALARVEKKTLVLGNGTEIVYSIVVPDDYKGEVPLPAILALAGSDQQSEAVSWGLRHYWQAEAEARGYIVVSPQPPRRMFYEGGEKHIPEFLERIKVLHKIRGNQFHVTGISSGGLSAFQVASRYPQYFTSVMVISGFVWVPGPAKYKALKDKCIVQIVGAHDVQWVDGALRDQEKFREVGARPFFRVLPGPVHRGSPYIDRGAAKLFDMIEHRVGCKDAITRIPEIVRAPEIVRIPER
jgi:pimeloyl-ACP methyl ester carboxylesterase